MNTPTEEIANPSRCDFSSLDVKVSPRKSNLSFKFNIDLKNASSDESSDSENADLQIDIAEIDNYQAPKKRSRVEIDMISALGEMEEEIERQLDAKAAKTNLTATNVKNILRNVITDEHVMAMVQNRLQNVEEKINFEPKLTRAKAKELAMTQPNMPWPMTPAKKTSSFEVQELIDKDLPEDSSDEEYSPDQDQQSDEEADGDHLTSSDVDSQPSTPSNSEAAPPSPVEQPPAEIHYDNDGVFKIPELPHFPTEVESIGQRTRSKLCLSETPLEQIEQAFIPPDITIDMYDWDCDTDPDWDNFLKEFTQPLGHDAAIEDDPEADPEYNILEDKEIELLDKEEMRVDKAVKVTKKELNDLVAELFEFEDMFSNGQVETPKKRNTPDNSMISAPNISTNNCMIDLLPALAEPELPKLVNAGQLNLLGTQLRQHVQLMTQHFGMLYMYAELHTYAKKCKENLLSLSYLIDGSKSVFNVENLPAALEFVKLWESKFQDESFAAEYAKFAADEVQRDVVLGNNGHKYTPKIHPELASAIVESKAFMYPHLLPPMQFRTYLINSSRSMYLKSEDFLIALGLEQFTPFVQAKTTKFKNKMVQLMDTTQLIAKYMVPCRSVNAILKHILSARAEKKPNPINHYFRTGSAPRTIHCIMLDYAVVAPKDQPRHLLPRTWQEFMTKEYATKLWRKQRRPLSNETKRLAESTAEIVIDEGYRNTIVNALPSLSKHGSSSKINGDEDIGEANAAVLARSDDASQRSPQLRKTTPRLAKIRSAQNMKLMTQVTGSKGLSNCSRMKSRGKSESSKDSEESCGSTKGDNEDEIAELMLASTTIKKDSANRKKAKQARELENIKRLLEAESESAQEERAAKFAESYLQKLHVTLESGSPETVRSIFRIFLEYNEKMESLRDMQRGDVSLGNENHHLSVQKNDEKEKLRKAKDTFAIDLYKDVCNALRDYPELRTDFLLFLNPNQAAMIDESTQHTMLRKMSEFMNVVQIYFAKQPSRLTKIMKAITQLASDRDVTMADVHAAMDPILRGHPLVMDMFLQVLPMGKPPDSLFAMNLFENLTCPPMAPYDKHKVYTEDSPELYEVVELPLPTSQDDPYGGDNCKCDCHDSSDPNLKTAASHCVSCGTKFLNGRIYLQTSEGLRPAKVTFPGSDEEKLDNIARISVKTTERFVAGTPSTRRRKLSKNETGLEESTQKQCTAKTSPTKDNEESEKSVSKSKRGVKSPPKTGDQKKVSKFETAPQPSTSFAGTTGEPTSPLKSKRETRAERREAKLELKNTGLPENARSSEETCPATSEQPDDSSVHANSLNLEVNDSEEIVMSETMDGSMITSESDVSMELVESLSSKPWTRHEDMILLQNIKKNYSESTFVAVSEMLGDRTVEQVQERTRTLLSLLEKMV